MGQQGVFMARGGEGYRQGPLGAFLAPEAGSTFALPPPSSRHHSGRYLLRLFQPQLFEVSGLAGVRQVGQAGAKVTPLAPKAPPARLFSQELQGKKKQLCFQSGSA